MTHDERSEVTDPNAALLADYHADLAAMERRFAERRAATEADLQRQLTDIRQAAEGWKERQKMTADDWTPTDADYQAAAERYAENRMKEVRKRDREYLLLLAAATLVITLLVLALTALITALAHR